MRTLLTYTGSWVPYEGTHLKGQGCHFNREPARGWCHLLHPASRAQERVEVWDSAIEPRAPSRCYPGRRQPWPPESISSGIPGFQRRVSDRGARSPSPGRRGFRGLGAPGGDGGGGSQARAARRAGEGRGGRERARAPHTPPPGDAHSRVGAAGRPAPPAAARLRSTQPVSAP